MKEKLESKYEINDLNNNKNKIQKINLNFMTYEQGGRSILLNACKAIAEQVKLTKLEIKDVNRDLVDDYVTSKVLILIHEFNLLSVYHWN